MAADEPEATPRPVTPPRWMVRWGPRGSALLLSLGAVVLLLIGATLGVALAPARSAAPAASSGIQPGPVDIGFSRDMIVHHTQGVSMANQAELHAQDDDVRSMAFDISTTQQTDIGELNGWLDLWGMTRISPDEPMTWMTSAGHAGMDMGGTTMSSTDAAAAADGAVMPGMATNTELAKLRKLTGTPFDVDFLQLMIRHHQGGALMMQYAVGHASLLAVRNFAGKMLSAQTGEITLMTALLKKLKAAPLPFTGSTAPTS